MYKDTEKDLFIAFLSPFSVYATDATDACREWAGIDTKNVGVNTMHQYLGKHSANKDLDRLLFCVRCFFHVNQQMFYREELLVQDPQALKSYNIRKLELRFLFMLFRHGLPHRSVEFERNDVCAVICPTAGTPMQSPQCPRDTNARR